MEVSKNTDERVPWKTSETSANTTTHCPAGVPLYCFLIVMIFPFLSFLSVSSSSNVVLTWLVDLITAGGIID